MQTQTANILVLGVGNVLLKDEGVGVHVVRELLKLALPENVEVIDGGTAVLDVLIARPGLDELVIIDTVKSGKEPGTIYKARFKGAEFLGSLEQPKISLHQVGLIEGLAIAKKLECLPAEIVIVGIEPAELDWGLELTEQVKRKIPEIINAVFEEIENVVHERQTSE